MLASDGFGRGPDRPAGCACACRRAWLRHARSRRCAAKWRPVLPPAATVSCLTAVSPCPLPCGLRRGVPARVTALSRFRPWPESRLRNHWTIPAPAAFRCCHFHGRHGAHPCGPTRPDFGVAIPWLTPGLSSPSRHNRFVFLGFLGPGQFPATGEWSHQSPSRQSEIIAFWPVDNEDNGDKCGPSPLPEREGSGVGSPRREAHAQCPHTRPADEGRAARLWTHYIGRPLSPMIGHSTVLAPPLLHGEHAVSKVDVERHTSFDLP